MDLLNGILFLGPILAQVSSQMVLEEMGKVKLFDGEEEGEEGSSEISILTEKSFDSFVKENPSVLVMFYAPWCGHCKNIKPKLIAAATKMKKEGIDGKLAVVDCTKENKLATQFGINAYPNFKHFGQFQTRDIKDIKEEQDIIDVMKNSIFLDNTNQSIGTLYFNFFHYMIEV